MAVFNYCLSQERNVSKETVSEKNGDEGGEMEQVDTELDIRVECNVSTKTKVKTPSTN
jgi:hypothetical protein